MRKLLCFVSVLLRSTVGSTGPNAYFETDLDSIVIARATFEQVDVRFFLKKILVTEQDRLQPRI